MFLTLCPFPSPSLAALASLVILASHFSDQLPLIVLNPKDVGRGGVDALDKFLALGATLGAAEEEGFALSSSVELSTECTTVSSAVESPTAGAATLLKVHVVFALDPEFIVVVEERLQLSLVGRAYD